VVLSHEETVALADHTVAAAVFATVDARDFQLLVESARIRLAYAHDRLYVVWDPLGPNHRLVKIQNPYGRLEHAVKCREVIRRYEVPAAAIDAVRSNDGQPNPNL
jgi:hypothetical protein